MFDRKSFKTTLTRLGYEDARFTTKRVSFEDLARDSAIFVTIDRPIKPEHYEDVRQGARAAGGIFR